MWKNKSRELIKSAPEIEDHDFIKIIEINGDNKQLAIAIRKVFADICKVPKEHINPETNFKLILKSMRSGLLEGWDRLDFVFRLERELKIKIYLPIDFSHSFKSSDFNSLTFKDILLELLSKLEIKSPQNGSASENVKHR
ncbi:MAG: hypothetical protein ACYTET_01060 [Planctomycetota bacterium]|jgi:hypothetical protein